MKEFILDFYGYFVFFYSLALILSYITLMVLSFSSQKRQKTFFSLPYVKKMLTDSPYTPGISIVAPAYNEEKTILDNVHSLLSVDYPKFEVVIVNDGSTDSTLEKLIDEFELVQVPFAYRERVKSEPVRRVFQSKNKNYDKLTVVDKKNGGTKADASNAGVNVAKYPYFIDTDVDCIIDVNALYRLIWPVLTSHKRVIAVSSTMLMSNGCRIENGVLIKEKVPHTPVPLFQQLEYMRSFLVSKMGWATLNAIPNVSGGFGFFDREIVVAVGGYDSQSFAEDMDLLVRMVMYMCDLNKPYKVDQVPETCCWTEGPPTVGVLNRQRTRWARGLLQYMSVHRKVLLNPHYKQMGMLTVPYLFFFEFMAPIVEATGFVVFIWLLLTNGINWTTMWIIFLMVYVFNIFLTGVVCFFSYYVGASYWRSIKSGYLLIFLASLFEPFFYHPMITFFSVKGYLSYFTKRNFKWEAMKRQGFGNREEESKEKEKTASGMSISAVPLQQKKEDEAQ
jgi:cellulose synthase/poly-beta-1,6-N-acetylglucosamine synthase-like glycosyltransferase